jgi:hypothetical protein
VREVMEKVCRGCFAEWESDYEKCPKCGWEPEKEPDKWFGWKTGDVLEKRYLVGKLFCVTRQREAGVWRMYDNLLGISCFAFLIEEENKERLRNVAKSLEKGSAGTGEVVVQTMKTIGKHQALILSLKNRYMDIKAFQKLTNTKAPEQEPVLAEMEEETVREQALPAGICLKNHYRIIDCIGIGGFGITYLCEDIRLHRLVAVKEYYPAEWAERDNTYVAVKSSHLLEPYRYGMQSFLKEIKITAKFMHTPHIVTLYDAFEENDTAYMVMEYILGISIGREMRTKGYKPYAIMEVVDMIFPVLDAVKEMHDCRIIHSDISPGNMMITQQGEIYLIDMGAAKYNLESQPPISAAFLKVDYAAPEQYRTAKEGISDREGPWTDIYAIGATMYYLLTGTKPPDVIKRLNGQDTDLTEGLIGKLPMVWVELLQKAMALEPAERVSSVVSLRELMESIL